MFADRREAGQELAARLREMAIPRPVVLALPRGGVPVAAEIARALKAPMDLVMVRKLGAPGQPELAMGAVAWTGGHTDIVLNDDVVRLLGVTDPEIQRVRQRELEVIAERERRYLGDRPRPRVAGRTAVVVDDGIATGATVRAALAGLRARAPAEIWLAVPVAPPDTLRALRSLADRVICLETPEHFRAVGLHYRQFAQVSNEEVAGMLRREDADP